MTYEYCCKNCDHEFELVNVPIAKKEDATKEPCPKCGKKTVEVKLSPPTVSYTGVKTVYQRAGNGWKDVQKKIAAAAGKRNTIRTK